MERQLNYILARNSQRAIKGVLSTEEAIYEVNIQSQIRYAPTHQLDKEENEWFYIEEFRESELHTPITKIGGEEVKIEELFERLIEYRQLQLSDYPDIAWLITKQGECYYFQKVLRSSRIENKTILSFRVSTLELKEINNSVVVNRESPDIIYDTNADKLIFKSLSRAKEIYPSLINLYREATRDEVESFLSSRIDLTCSISPDKVGTRNRKEIARLREKIDRLSDTAKESLATYVDRQLVKAGLQKGDDGRIIISKSKDLSSYLALLDERFITSEIYEEDRKITAFTSA
jgi:hypothetical protein